jgi:hypothetical protein
VWSGIGSASRFDHLGDFFRRCENHRSSIAHHPGPHNRGSKPIIFSTGAPIEKTSSQGHLPCTKYGSCWIGVPVSHQFHSKGDQKSLPALSLREPDAGSAAILGNEFHTGFSECGYERLAGFSATTNVSLGGLQSLYRRRGYPGVCGQIILGPAEQRSRRFDLAY